MSINLHLPAVMDLRPRIVVLGLGGAGCNAVNNMIASGLSGVEFVVANTDAQALASSSAELRIQLGVNLTEGLGAGSKPEIGQAAAEEALDDIRSHISGAHILFIAAGMGGGTGTGAAGVIARVARDLGILTVAIVTKPFQFEGTRRLRIAEAGIGELRKYVDTLIVIPNQNLFRIANERTTFAEAFVLADQVLYSGIACIVDLIVKEGLINLDFADVRTVLADMGTAMMGTGEAAGERRAIRAAEEAISNPLLDEVSLRGAKGLLLSIIGGRDLTLYEVDEAASRVREEVDGEANIIVGATFDESLEDRIRVSIVASGMGGPAQGRPQTIPPPFSSAAAPRGNAAGATIASRGGQPAHGLQEPSTQAAEEFARALTAVLDSDTVETVGRRGEPQRRPVWESPDGVVIEEGLAPLGSASPPPLPPSSVERRAPDQGFAPAPPADIKRSARRIPDIEDFPEVGQRDYRSKMAAGTHGSGGRGYDADAAHARRKPGLLERLTGLGRRESDDDHGSDDKYPQAATVSVEHRAVEAESGRPRRPPGGVNRHDRESSEPNDLRDYSAGRKG